MVKSNLSVFQILDLDRTLFNTSKLAQQLKEIIAHRNPALAQEIEVELQQCVELHTSFFIFEYVAHLVGHDELTRYIDELQATIPEADFLLPGAKERIAFAKSQPGWSVGILTYGSKRDQMIKLKLAGLQMERHLITDSPKKGALIASWKLPNGTYKLPLEFGGHIVERVTLDDDKRVAFDDLPSDVLGQWVTHASIGGVTEMKYLATNIRPVANLKESISYLKTQLL